MPSGPEASGAAGQKRDRAPIVTRLVTLALMAVAAAVVVAATSQTHGPDRARVAAETSPALVLPAGEPSAVRILDAERKGDAILLRVNPVGAGGAQTLVVSPGARVSGESLQTLLAAAADSHDAMHRVRYDLSYDVNGAVVAVTPAR